MWITYSTRAFVVCTECGLEREVGGDAAKLVVASAASRLEMLGSMHREDQEGAGAQVPEGIERERQVSLVARIQHMHLQAEPVAGGMHLPHLCRDVGIGRIEQHGHCAGRRHQLVQ